MLVCTQQLSRFYLKSIQLSINEKLLAEQYCYREQNTIGRCLDLEMAEVAIAREVLGEQPLLLLDDVMSELDASRRDAMTRFVQGGIQTVVTTTNLSYFPAELLESAEVISYGPAS